MSIHVCHDREGGRDGSIVFDVSSEIMQLNSSRTKYTWPSKAVNDASGGKTMRIHVHPHNGRFFIRVAYGVEEH